MKDNKPSLESLRAAWQLHTAGTPSLDESWLKRAINKATIGEPVESRMNHLQFALGIALSAAVSVLIFLSGNTYYQGSYSNPSALYYLINDTEYSLFDSEAQ